MTKLEKYTTDLYGKRVYKCTDSELYSAIMRLVEDKTAQLPTRDEDEKKKLYYFSAEFLIGKLLSNNLINLGLYNEIKNELVSNGKNLMNIEQIELEPSLGNGGLGRLAACFVDSITKKGINGDGIGLNYHFGLFRQAFVDNEQHARQDTWIVGNDWIRKSDITFDVPYKNFTLQSTLYDLDVAVNYLEIKISVFISFFTYFMMPMIRGWLSVTTSMGHTGRIMVSTDCFFNSAGGIIFA